MGKGFYLTGLLFLGALSLLTSSFIGCSKSSPYRRAEWSSHDSSKNSSPSALEELKKDLTEIQWKDTGRIYLKSGVVRWRQQTLGGIPILGTWIKENESENKTRFLSLNTIIAKNELSLPPEFDRQSEDFQKALVKIRKLSPRFEKWMELRAALLPQKKKLLPVWVLVGLTKEHELHRRLIHAQTYEVLEEEKVGSSFMAQIPQLKARVYPDGPKRSSLEDVELLSLNPGDFLSSNKLKISSASGTNIAVSQNPLLYPVTDRRFSQVQVFFILQKANAWFEKNLGWTWAGLLNVETDLGYPDQINSAFYYHNRIRLGEGDGKVYQDIPLDPSISIHESAHSVIDRMTDLPTQGEGGSLNEAFADFFAACVLKRPFMGEVAYKEAPYTRNLAAAKSWQDLNGGLYNDSLVVSTLLWRLRAEIGEKEILDLSVSTLREVTPDETIDSFRKKLMDQAAETLSPENFKKFTVLLKEFQWPLS